MHKRVKHPIITDRGLSLLETVLAIALGAMIFIPLTMAFRVGTESWDANTIASELYQHARVAQQRISTDLRYAVDEVNCGTPDVMQFTTRQLVNDDWKPELIKYERQAAAPDFIGILYRSQEGGPLYPIAGSEGRPPVDVSAFSCVVAQKSGQADKVYVNLTLTADGGAKSVNLVWPIVPRLYEE